MINVARKAINGISTLYVSLSSSTIFGVPKTPIANETKITETIVERILPFSDPQFIYEWNLDGLHKCYSKQACSDSH